MDKITVVYKNEGKNINILIQEWIDEKVNSSGCKFIYPNGIGSKSMGIGGKNVYTIH